jgi:hypothetical protein
MPLHFCSQAKLCVGGPYAVLWQLQEACQVPALPVTVPGALLVMLLVLLPAE